ncbi:reverse transcriptase domain-containing protein [Tanacetum coccineum]|uniref:Reverse transcriptase domain-containing protein n=1 Tax=Tanacetum coccineum TaxID=301880 RepID=A0ABQ5C5C4_9ASTR
MARADEEKMAFYTDQGMYCYTKMPFGLKSFGATYQRLVDTAFQSQIGRNLEAYVDDMVIKRNDERMIIADITETFDNLQRINMKLNLKKCSFRVDKGKFLRYMVTYEGIRANPKKTKAIVDIQSPQTLKEMQILSGKLVTLKRFLSRSAERSLPFFDTLKDITKENKDDYRWTEDAEKAFQEMKKVIMELPLLTTPRKEETLYVYLAAVEKVVSSVLLEERNRKQCPIHYVSRTLNEAGRNYAQIEKLALSLLHMSRRNAIKGQVLADFLLEAPVGIPPEEFFRLSAKVHNKDSIEKWTLFTDGASNSKGFGAGLVLISPSDMEFTYALRLDFTSINNEAEYEALPSLIPLPALLLQFTLPTPSILLTNLTPFLLDSTSRVRYSTEEFLVCLKNGFRIKDSIEKWDPFHSGAVKLQQHPEGQLATHVFDHLMKEVLVEVLSERLTDQREVSAIVEEDDDNWMTPIIRCLAEGVWPKDKDKRRSLRMKTNQYVLEE